MFATLSRLLNKAIQCDEASSARIAALQGKVATLELLPFHFAFQCVFTEAGVRFEKGELLSQDIKIAGTPLQLLSLSLADLTIIGDAELGQAILALFKAYRPDWEEGLSAYIGDIPAYHAHRAFQKMTHCLRRFRNNVTENVTEYIHEEAEWFPSREALNDFYEEVDALREAVDRLEERMKC
ncbi:MAG: hypothetical protein ACD_44C00271G0001 [uncultured bacterium]|nr:MAG: hypothetical protein ACD_44C00271G0001 [uncultured bacterium]